MDKVIEKISSYNLFTNLLPGAVFVIFLEMFWEYEIMQTNVLVNLAVFYFFGMLVGRVGSLIVEPILLKTKIIEYSMYSDFVKASKEDSLIDILKESNNMYRTFTGVFLSLLLVKGVDAVVTLMRLNSMVTSLTIIVLLFLVFLLSYRKQTAYIKNRVKKTIERIEGEE